MLEPLIRRSRRGLQRDFAESLPGPVGGWNVRDPLSKMPAKDAVILENWFPEAHQVRTRPGSALVSGVLTSPVACTDSTLMVYNGVTASRLFATGSNIFTGAGAFASVLPGSLGSIGYTNLFNRFSYTNITTVGGNFLIAVNGQDDVRYFDGTAWGQITGASVPAITGVPTTELAFVATMVNRLWFARNNSLTAYFLPVDSIGGAVGTLPLGTVFNRGGYLMAFASWSLDAGDGIDDYSVFVSSEGEVAVYRGSDPTTAADFALVGVYYIGEPLGRECLTRFGGDLLFLCKTGLFPLSKAIQSASIDRRFALTDKISVAFAQAVASYGSLDGWQCVVFPGGPFVLVNIPTGTATAEQFVMNTITGAWCKFTGWHAASWAVYEGNLYYVLKEAAVDINSRTDVMQAWTGTSDYDPSTGDPIAIPCRGQQAFSYFARQAMNKHCKLLRPILSIDGGIALSLGLATDFGVPDFSSVNDASPSGGFLWDLALWDTATWISISEGNKNWYTVFAPPFYAAALRLQVASATATVRWTSTDFLLEKAGVL